MEYRRLGRSGHKVSALSLGSMNFTKPIHSTTAHQLQGVARDGVLRFNGIPFAKPPVGQLRWRLPEAPEPWVGTRDASRFGNTAPQIESASGAVLGGTPGTRSVSPAATAMKICCHSNTT